MSMALISTCRDKTLNFHFHIGLVTCVLPNACLEKNLKGDQKIPEGYSTQDKKKMKNIA